MWKVLGIQEKRLHLHHPPPFEDTFTWENLIEEKQNKHWFPLDLVALFIMDTWAE